MVLCFNGELLQIFTKGFLQEIREDVRKKISHGFHLQHNGQRLIRGLDRKNGRRRAQDGVECTIVLLIGEGLN